MVQSLQIRVGCVMGERKWWRGGMGGGKEMGCGVSWAYVHTSCLKKGNLEKGGGGRGGHIPC